MYRLSTLLCCLGFRKQGAMETSLQTCVLTELLFSSVEPGFHQVCHSPRGCELQLSFVPQGKLSSKIRRISRGGKWRQWYHNHGRYTWSELILMASLVVSSNSIANGVYLRACIRGLLQAHDLPTGSMYSSSCSSSNSTHAHSSSIAYSFTSAL